MLAHVHVVCVRDLMRPHAASCNLSRLQLRSRASPMARRCSTSKQARCLLVHLKQRMQRASLLVGHGPAIGEARERIWPPQHTAEEA